RVRDVRMLTPLYFIAVVSIRFPAPQQKIKCSVGVVGLTRLVFIQKTRGHDEAKLVMMLTFQATA
ncbi:MAG TPA: hypothetical protein VK177_20415, partial [Flavobacteriales bacterium]|nr:hypothetical protein [Flavobacteriales bacterium]